MKKSITLEKTVTEVCGIKRAVYKSRPCDEIQFTVSSDDTARGMVDVCEAIISTYDLKTDDAAYVFTKKDGIDEIEEIISHHVLEVMTKIADAKGQKAQPNITPKLIGKFERSVEAFIGKVGRMPVSKFESHSRALKGVPEILVHPRVGYSITGYPATMTVEIVGQFDTEPEISLLYRRFGNADEQRAALIDMFVQRYREDYAVRNAVNNPSGIIVFPCETPKDMSHDERSEEEMQLFLGSSIRG